MKPLYWLGYTLSATIARAAFQYRAYGRENIIEEGPAIMAANHQSYLDPPLVGITCRNELYYLARKTLFDKKLLGPIISRVNALPVDLSRGDLTAFRAVMNLLKEGHRTVIFPEGTRVAPGERHAYQPGVAALYQALALPLVPAAVNSGLYWGRRSFVKRKGRIVLEFLEPIPPGRTRPRLMAELERRVETATAALLREGQETRRR